MRYRFAVVLLPVLMTMACSGGSDTETSASTNAPASGSAGGVDTSQPRVKIVESGLTRTSSWTVVQNDEDREVSVHLDYSATTEKGRTLKPSTASTTVRFEVIPPKSTVGIVRNVTWSELTVGEDLVSGETRLDSASRETYALEHPPGELEAGAPTPGSTKGDTEVEVASTYPQPVRNALVSVLCRDASNKVVGLGGYKFDVSPSKPAKVTMTFGLDGPSASCKAYPIITSDTRFGD